ncbi:MAG: uxaC [Spirosoma sp.]|nr:uxaC [Spirosoma sp.]
MSYLTPDFLLQNPTGRSLYHTVAAALPIIDFHNHIDPAAVATNRAFQTIQEAWVSGDPYKHRAMRICGVPERLITGDAPDFEKFMTWAKCLKKTVGNPLFHWSCLELHTIFGIDAILDEDNAPGIWTQANALLSTDAYRARAILEKFRVERLCTSDDLADSLVAHQSMVDQNTSVACLPSLRGDSIVAFGQATFQPWLATIGQQTGMTITDLASFQMAIKQRLDFFACCGCLLADHSFDSGFQYVTTSESDASVLFANQLAGQSLTADGHMRLQSYLLYFLGQQYARRHWRMQLHIGAFRYTSTRLRNQVGGAGGFAAIGHPADIAALSRFLDDLDITDHLPKTILYTLNPADNAAFASLTGSFSADGIAGKIQFGPAWWYNDHAQGITEQLTTLAHYGLLSSAIGMTTDSRSIFSMTRHDYYRRILCNLVGGWAETGHLPNDPQPLADLIEAISYKNAKNWLSND